MTATQRPGLFIFSTFIYFLFIAADSNAQLHISGKVVSEQTGLPISGASIYFNNTSIGTSSNAKGEFVFNGVGIVNTELIISSVGYEILIFKLDPATPNGKYFLCKLSIKEQQLKEVLILSDARKKQYLALFKENFLGVTEEAAKSNILNLNDIYFTKGEIKNSFKAYADTPLVIINHMLGYKIYFQLIEFSFDEHSGRTYFYGYTRYEELGFKKRWIKNRRDAYYGSTLHFYRSLVRDQLPNEKYDIYIVKNMQKDSTAPAMSMGISTTAAQIVSIDSADSNYYRVSVPSRKLMVQFKKNPASKIYLGKKFLLQGSTPFGFRSDVVLNGPYFLVDHNGIIKDPLSVEYTGYWIYEKSANLLPYNYEP